MKEIQFVSWDKPYVCKIDSRDPPDWDWRFLSLSELVASWSKDGSTKVGCVIVDPLNRIVSLGYNGFPRGVDDAEERYADRDFKKLAIVHAEANAVAFAKRDLTGCTIYTTPFQPCSSCAGLIVQSGITRVVAPPTPLDKADRWKDSFDAAKLIFSESGVTLHIVGE